MIASSAAVPILSNRFEKVTVIKNYQYCTKNLEVVQVEVDPRLKNFLEYCEGHESEIFKTLKSLDLPKNVLNQCKVKISPLAKDEDRAKIEIALPYKLLNDPFKTNWLMPEANEFVNFTFITKKVNSNCYLEAFDALLIDLSKTFKPWYQLAKKIAEYGEKGEFSKLFIQSNSWQAFPLKDRHKPNFDRSYFDISAFVNEHQEVEMNMSWHLKLSCYAQDRPISQSMICSSDTSLDDLFNLWKVAFTDYLEEVIEWGKTAAHRMENIDFNYLEEEDASDFNKLDELEILLELNGELSTHIREKEYLDFKALLKKQSRKILLKWHPDKAAQNGLDSKECHDKIEKINELLDPAKKYVDSLIIAETMKLTRKSL